MKGSMASLVLILMLTAGCATMPPRTYVLSQETVFNRQEYAILLVSEGNQVTEVDGASVLVVGRSPEDEIALLPGKHSIKAHQTGKPIRSDSADFDAQAGHLYKLVREDFAIQNLTMSVQGGPTINLGSGSFYTAKIQEVSDMPVVELRFASTNTTGIIRVEPILNSPGTRTGK